MFIWTVGEKKSMCRNCQHWSKRSHKNNHVFFVVVVVHLFANFKLLLKLVFSVVVVVVVVIVVGVVVDFSI